MLSKVASKKVHRQEPGARRTAYGEPAKPSSRPTDAVVFRRNSAESPTRRHADDDLPDADTPTRHPPIRFSGPP